MAAVNVTGLKDLLALSTAEISAAANFPGGYLDAPCRDGCQWAPTVDGVELVDFPWEVIKTTRPPGKWLIL